ncbi:DNA polymerase III subunit alpha [Candidatus Falkowbacteria bacterium]|nr:DNA polymerase III subunit alpha [Candidatus Falkowbacteria bacterium]
MQFTHLHTHSHYSLLDGLAKIGDLVAKAKEYKMESLALTDHGVMYGAIEFYKTCKDAGIKPIIGCEVYVAPNGRLKKRPRVDEERFHLILLAKNDAGYKNLLKLTSKAHLEGFYYKPRVDLEILKKHSEGLIASSACLQGEISRLILSDKRERAKEKALEYKEIFGEGNFYLEVQHHPNIPEQGQVNEIIFEISRETEIPCIATNDVHYLEPDDAEAQDILLCLQTKKKLTDTDRMNMMGEDFSFYSSEKILAGFPTHPEVVENTQKIAEKCNLEIELGEIKLPHFEVPGGASNEEYLEKLCAEGLVKRYGYNRGGQKTEDGGRKDEAGVDEIVMERLAYELGIIEKTGFAPYFLIVADFVNWAKDRAIVVGPGRGSAAGSIVSYLLNITDLDPIKYELLFERFLNPERISMPDIDLDFADVRRDEVIEYVSQKYGKDHVSQIITFGTMAARAAIRDVGRVFDMSYSYCDQIAKMIPMFTGLFDALEANSELKDMYEKDPEAKKLIDTAMKLEGVARHASTHACGVVITKEASNNYIPLQYDSKADEKAVVSQYSMKPIEDLGLLKMDFLGLKNLTIMERALKQIKYNRNIEVEIDKIPLDDAKTFELLRKGDTTGVFQLESAGMKRYLKQLKPTELEDIIAMVSLYRPGPMEWIPDYIDGKHGRKKPYYLHPKLEPILEKTYGVAIYQEQVLEIARDLAGFTLGEADILRKAVGKKIKNLLDEQKIKFIDGCVTNGVNRKVAEKVFSFIEPFAGYGFNRSHAACYAMIAYETAFLKANFPGEFMASLLTSDHHDADRIAIEVEECRGMGIEVLPPDINESFKRFAVVQSTTAEDEQEIRNPSTWLRAGKKQETKDVNDTNDANNEQHGKIAPSDPSTSLRAGELRVTSDDTTSETNDDNNDNKQSGREAIRFGLLAIKNVGEHIVEVVVAERQENGPYQSLEDFLERVEDKDLNKKSLESLIKSGALDRFGDRNQLLSNLELILNFSKDIQQEKASSQGNLFREAGQMARPSLALQSAEAIDKKTKLSWEKELLGLYISEHPFMEFEGHLRNITRRANDTEGALNANVKMAGVITDIKKIITKSNEPMLFVKIEDTTGTIEILVFPRTLKATEAIWQEEKAVVVSGQLSDKDGVSKVLCGKVWEITREGLEKLMEEVKAYEPSNRNGRYYGNQDSGRAYVNYSKKQENNETKKQNTNDEPLPTKKIEITVPNGLSHERSTSLKSLIKQGEGGEYKVCFAFPNAQTGIAKKIVTNSYIKLDENVKQKIEGITGVGSVNLEE